MQLGSGLWCLSLDAVSFRKVASGKEELLPHELTNVECDEIMELVRSVPKDEHLVIASHYGSSPDFGDRGAYEMNETDWFERHIWVAATPLRERVYREFEVRGSKAVWLCGDIHVSAEKRYPEKNPSLWCYATGRLGTRIGKVDSHVRRHARVITIGEDAIRSTLFAYDYPGESQGQYGDWRQSGESPFDDTIPVVLEESESPRTIDREDLTSVSSAPESEARAIIGYGDRPDHVQRLPVTSRYDNEAGISTNVRSNRLLKWGRFKDEDFILLTWLPIAQIMNEPGRVGSVVSAMSDWLDAATSELRLRDQSGLVLLGLDCWGSVLASQVSVVLGVSANCIATRGRGKHHTSLEGIDREPLQTQLHNAEVVVMVTDVVATGSTLHWVYQQLNKQTPDAKWLALSIVTDPKQELVADCSFIEAHGCACTSLRMPILPADRISEAAVGPHDFRLD